MAKCTDEDFTRALHDKLEIAGMERHAHTEHDDTEEQDGVLRGPGVGRRHEISADDRGEDEKRKILAYEAADFGNEFHHVTFLLR